MEHKTIGFAVCGSFCTHSRAMAALEQVAAQYERVIPIPFVSDWMVATGIQESIAPEEVHKYTVVVWLEGDDPDCTDELIGGHIGMDFGFLMLGENADTRNNPLGSLWENLTSGED